jgi:predicted metalloprotease with PDZ domain
LRTPQQCRDDLAAIGATLDHQAGRSWRPLVDTAVSAQVLYGAPDGWESWRRSVDFYGEGVLIWLEADAIIRRESHGTQSLDDFCRLFHGGTSGEPQVKPYTFDQLVTALEQVVPYNWSGFFTTRLTSTSSRAPLGGIEACGWKVAYSESLPSLQKSIEESTKLTDVRFSIGIHVDEKGNIVDVIPGLPAALAGIAPGSTLVAVNGRKWSPKVLRDALRATPASKRPLELLVENDEFYVTHRLNYRGGERYPHLQRIPDRPDLLAAIFTPAGTTVTAR